MSNVWEVRLLCPVRLRATVSGWIHTTRPDASFRLANDFFNKWIKSEICHFNDGRDEGSAETEATLFVS